jgi:hypothetical protein
MAPCAQSFPTAELLLHLAGFRSCQGLGTAQEHIATCCCVQDANFHNDESRSDIYAKLADPNSDWPEPRLQGGHVDDVKAHWLPQGQVREVYA